MDLTWRNMGGWRRAKFTLQMAAIIISLFTGLWNAKGVAVEWLAQSEPLPPVITAYAPWFTTAGPPGSERLSAIYYHRNRDTECHIGKVFPEAMESEGVWLPLLATESLAPQDIGHRVLPIQVTIPKASAWSYLPIRITLKFWCPDEHTETHTIYGDLLVLPGPPPVIPPDRGPYGHPGDPERSGA